MLGWIICGEGEAVPPEYCTVRGVPFLRLWAPPPHRRRERRFLAASLKEMYRRGVRRAVVEGAVWEEVVQAGILPVDVSVLRRALLPQLLAWADREWELDLGRSTVQITARRAEERVYRAALDAGRAGRYVHLAVGAGQEELETLLCRRMGLSGGGRPVLEVCLDGESCAGVPWLDIGRGCGERQAVTLAAAGMKEAPESLLCALYEAEKLPIAEIQVRFVEFRA